MTRGPVPVPRANAGSGLLLALLALVLISAWPERGDVANTSWYTVAPVRATALAGWAWVAGLAARRGDSGAVPWLGRLALGALLTAPLEAFAHVASAPAAPLSWSLIAPLPLAWAFFGVARALALGAARVRATAALPIVAAAAAAGLVWLDLRLGLGWWTPWVVPSTPRAGAALVLALASLAVWAWAWRGERRPPLSPSGGAP